MEKQGFLPATLHLVKKVLFIDLAIFATVAIACWLGGVFTADEYGERLFWAGAAAILVGFFTLMGNLRATQKLDYQIGARYAASVSRQGMHQHLKQEKAYTAQNYGFFILMGIVGAVPIVVGALIQTVAR